MEDNRTGRWRKLRTHVEDDGGRWSEVLQTNEGQDLHHVTLSAGHVGDPVREGQRRELLRGFFHFKRRQNLRFCAVGESSSYLPAVKQLPFAAPNVEKATKSGTIQDRG